MKPIKLTLSNFKSYGEDTPELIFNQFDVILLTGQNGNGKSSIADAIAWAVWGQCKGVTQRSGVDDLVKTGAQDMEVSFIFEEEDNVYKVTRKRNKKKTQTTLSLMMLSQDEKFIPIGGSNINETQIKIEKLIKLDYETYLCTAYLSQGRADSFSIKSPRERKQILSEILDLGLYDRLEKKASEKRKIAEVDKASLEKEILLHSKLVEDNKDVKSSIEEIENKIEYLETTRKQNIDHLDFLKQKIHELEFLKEKEREFKNTLENYNKEITQVEESILIVNQKIQKHKKLIENESHIIEYQKKCIASREELDILNTKQRDIFETEKKIRELEHEVLLKESELQYELKSFIKECQNNKQEASKISLLEVQREEIRSKLSSLEALEQNLVNYEVILNEYRIQILEIESKILISDTKKNETQEGYDILLKAESQCPVCSNRLDEFKKKEILANSAGLIQKLEVELKQLNFELHNLRVNNKKIEDTVAKIKSNLKLKASIEAHYFSLDGKVSELSSLRNKILPLEDKIQDLKEILRKREFAQVEVLHIEKLKEKIKTLNYDKNKHSTLEKEMKTFDSIQSQWVELQKAKAMLEVEQTNLKNWTDSKCIKEKEKEILVLSYKNISSKIKQSGNLMEQYKIEKQNESKLHEEMKAYQLRKGELFELDKNVKNAEIEVLKKQKQIESKHRAASVYKYLAEVYGKSGIQAAIIENLIPELEIEANQILGKITDGRLFVEFLMQKDKKSGGIIETLDIKISDESGTRKYETYSGGEEFRINFAIRIALSKVLAHRAGASLRFLILDEGFGVLDEEGREKLLETINAIKHDFDNILVITHIQDLKEAFPLRLEVYKTSTGSKYRLLG